MAKDFTQQNTENIKNITDEFLNNIDGLDIPIPDIGLNESESLLPKDKLKEVIADRIITIIAREIDKNPEFLIAAQPTRGLDVGAIEYIHKQLVAQRDAGKAVLLVSLELDEVMDVPDRILVMYEGEIVGELDPKTTTQEELGLYMAGAKRDEVKA